MPFCMFIADLCVSYSSTRSACWKKIVICEQQKMGELQATWPWQTSVARLVIAGSFESLAAVLSLNFISHVFLFQSLWVIFKSYSGELWSKCIRFCRIAPAWNISSQQSLHNHSRGFLGVAVVVIYGQVLSPKNGRRSLVQGFVWLTGELCLLGWVPCWG